MVVGRITAPPPLVWASVDQDITKWPGYQAGLNALAAEQRAADQVSFSYNPQSKNFVKTNKQTNLATYPIKDVPTGVTVSYTAFVPGTRKSGTKEVLIPFNEVAGKTRQEFEAYISNKIGSMDNTAANIDKIINTTLDTYEQSQLNQRENTANTELNKKVSVIEEQNKKTNDAIAQAETIAVAARGGDYIQQQNMLEKLNVSEQAKTVFETAFKDFYRDQKLQPWNSQLGAKPAYGDFNSTYYKTQNPNVQKQWEDAVANDDIDITERYGETNFYLQHYTTQGKPAGARGNDVEATQRANQYQENPPTDADLQAVRDLQLGVDTATQSQRLLNIPEIAEQWDAAKNGDPYWDKLSKEKYLDVSKPDEFAALFRLSNRPEDKQVSLNYNINTGYGVTQLEDALNQAVGEKTIVDVKKFGALAQNVLKDSIAEMKKAKAQEQTLGLIQGFSGFSEIMDINKTLTNSILGDSGVGGVLSFTSAGKAEESLTKSLQNITGVQNNTTYNWQQWFDKELKEKYNKDIELGYTSNQANEQVKIEGQFAREFIDTYLTPRFNTSRSMDEFVEYLDVRQEEQNPFQTQDLLNAATLTANLRAKSYLDQIKATSARSFDPNFYFSPTGDKAREANYADQASTVAADWEAAKNGDSYWQQQAYRFGVDINDKAAFARMHFEVKGQGKGYDAADDILNAGKVQDQIYSNILPSLKDEVLKQGTVFGLFVTPEEFADDMLSGLDPNNKDTWNEVLKQYGLTDFKGTVEELKQYVSETLRTGSAQDIREQIKYLNEKRQKPTQKVLGLTYIERPEDFKNEKANADTELYKTFQSAGFQGTEDEFYTKFFPDVDRSEQSLLTKAGGNKALKLSGLDFNDPFASLGTIEGFFADENAADAKKNKSSSTDKTDTSDFFSLGSNEEDEDYKSSTGQKILGEFTSMFKGL
jgi:hypothetical protein